MGLTIHYTITLPEEFGWKEAGRLVKEMRRLAFNAKRRGAVGGVLPADSAGEMRKWALEFRDYPIPEEPGKWWGAEIRPERGWIFPVDVGAGCEPLWLGLCQYPERVFVGGHHRRVTGLRGWRLQRHCKTQYASLHGWGHFRRCRLAVIELLAALRPLGFGVKISDEGHYWPRRSETALRVELEKMNRLVAATAGALKDANDEGAIEAAIFGHPQFERLEAEGEAEHGDPLRRFRRAQHDSAD